MKKTYEFEKWDDDLIFLQETLIEVLDELELTPLIQYLPWSKDFANKIEIPLKERTIQILSLCFALLNMVEENTANQVRRSRGTKGEGLWDETCKTLASSKINTDDLARKIKSINISPVLTAHPTEAKRATILEQHRKLYMLLVKRENSMWSEDERKQIKTDIKVIIETLLRTGDLYLERPSIQDELRNVSYYLKGVFPDAIKTLYLRFSEAWTNHFPDYKETPPFPTITFGNWVGGDRDGHPFVTSEITKNVLAGLRSSALEIVHHHIAVLAQNISFNSRLQPLPTILSKRISHLIELIGEPAVHALKRNPNEPWRQYLNLVALRIPSDNQSNIDTYKLSSELVFDLNILRESLKEIKASNLNHSLVEPTIATIESIGFHLAKLDIRQNSSFHEKALEQLFQAANIKLRGPYSTLDFTQKTKLLNQELQESRPLARLDDAIGKEADEIRKTYRVLKDHIKEFGTDGLGSLIISMSRDTSDLLSVYLLAKESELSIDYKETPITPLPVVPLFETVADLKRSTAVMREFLNHPITKRSHEFQNESNQHSSPNQLPMQEIMIGYSDSSKDGGILSSYWNLYQTQKSLYDLGSSMGVEFMFFHGRGGTVSRGAGPTNRFLSSLPKGTLSRGLKMTEQGETIGQKYGNLLTCSYNLELLQAGAVSQTLCNGDEVPNYEELSGLMALISEKSLNKYQALLAMENFVPFFKEATPIDAIEQSKFGSRPPKRTGADTLDDLRAIPWVFSLNQSRFFLSSWFGTGTALMHLYENDKDGWETLSNATTVSSWAPAQYVFTNIESSIYSADEDLMKQYAALVKDENTRNEILNIILEEYNLTRELLTKLFKKAFENRRPRMFKTLKFREEPLKVLHETQISLLKKWRDEKEKGIESDPDLLLTLLLTTNAIAGGLRTTG